MWRIRCSPRSAFPPKLLNFCGTWCCSSSSRKSRRRRCRKWLTRSRNCLEKSTRAVTALLEAIALWDGIERRPGSLGAPLLEGALGWIECRLRHEYEVGDHTLFVGEVVSVERGPATVPLVHIGSSYRPL